EKIGLKPLAGQKGYRQAFQKQLIVPGTTQVVINGQTLSNDKVLLATENLSVNASSGMGILRIDYDSTIANKRQTLISPSTLTTYRLRKLLKPLP
ncbi:MAG: hypothetical protein EBU52_09205, partial [Cytophagia bacterium]|nr:hypothetical protein [Cytophagia bacterium]